MEKAIEYGLTKDYDIYHSMEDDNPYMYTVLAKYKYFDNPANGIKYLYMAAYCGSFKIWKVIARAVMPNTFVINKCIKLSIGVMDDYMIDEDDLWNYRPNEFKRARIMFRYRVKSLYR